MIPVLVLLITLFFSPSSSTAAETAPFPEVQTYEQLVQAIRQMQQTIDPKNKQDKVREAWMTGKLIEAHEKNHYLWSDYPEQLNERLTKEFNVSIFWMPFYRRFIKIYPELPQRDLNLGHYIKLIQIPDPQQRERLMLRAEKEKWSNVKLVEEWKKTPDPKTVSSLSELARPGKLNFYRVIQPKRGPYQNQLVLDLGFSTYYQPEGIKAFKEGDIVQGPRLQLMKSATAKDLYTYKAIIILVLDGDTFDAIIALGFKLSTVQRFRLAGLDAPEIATQQGPAAKAFFINQIPKDGAVLLRSSIPDKYDRFLADVWIDGKHLNQLLLDQGFAVKSGE